MPDMECCGRSENLGVGMACIIIIKYIERAFLILPDPKGLVEAFASSKLQGEDFLTTKLEGTGKMRNALSPSALISNQSGITAVVNC